MQPGATPIDATSRKFIRGSSLLLAGRFISVLLNLAVQVLTVRYLSKADYGAFAYALGVVSMASSTMLLGLGKAVPRFVPIYHERRDYARTFGTIALAVGTVWGLGLSVVLLLFGMRGVLADRFVTDPLALSLLLVLIALAPLEAFDNLLQKLVAVFASPRAIFFRRHVLGPGLKLAAVLTVILVSGNVYLLAYGYLAGGLIGVWLYITILIRQWRRDGLLQHFRPGALRWPARELFGFSLPLLSSELPVILRGSLAIVLLEYFHTTTAVAEYRAVLPIAGLNMIVFEAFAFLFVPVASRMYARGDAAGISALFWTTSIWITVLSFPVFAVTFALADPLAVLLFGSAYAGSGTLLTLLAFGYYFNAALGFNSATLRVWGRVRYIVASDCLAAVAFMILSLLLIPPHGALGAAISTMGALVVHNLLNHLSLWLSGTGVHLVDRRFTSVFLTTGVVLFGLWLVQRLFAPPIHIGFGLAAVVSLVVIRLTRKVVAPETAFPALMRIPLIRQLLS